MSIIDPAEFLDAFAPVLLGLVAFVVGSTSGWLFGKLKK